jgi:hypothetical protein
LTPAVVLLVMSFVPATAVKYNRHILTQAISEAASHDYGTVVVSTAEDERLPIWEVSIAYVIRHIDLVLVPLLLAWCETDNGTQCMGLDL